MTICNNCGGPKPDDRYKACEGCREEWRRYSRKPGGPAETIEALRAENTRLKARIAELKRENKRLRAHAPEDWSLTWAYARVIARQEQREIKEIRQENDRLRRDLETERRHRLGSTFQRCR